MVPQDLPDGSEKATPTDAQSDKDDPTGSKMGRRSVLKLAGVAIGAAGIPTIAAGPGKAAIDVEENGDYELWTVSGQEVYDLSDGEVLTNVLVDQTAADASLTIRSQNKSGWEVRNVGFLGTGIDDQHGYQLQVSAPDGGNGLVENLWANGKERGDQAASELGGIFIRSPHAGHIDIKHTYIEGFGNNAVYASGVGKDNGNDGSVTIENCYHRDNTSTQFRIGSPGSVVRNSVAVVNDPEGLRGTYPYSDSQNARGIWGKHYRDQRVENSSFYVSPDDVNPDGAFESRYIEDRSHGDEAVAEISQCDVNADAPILTGTTSNASVNFTDLGESPTVDVIQDGGVPTSPEMAARGNREMPPALPGESGGSDDGSTDVSALDYPNDATTVQADHYDTDDAAGVSFSMSNTADQPLTVSHVTVSPRDASIDGLHDESSEVGPWVSEVHIDADVQDGVCDVPGSATLPNTFDMANDGWSDAADDVAILSAGASASVSLSRFEDGGTPIDMTGTGVDIEVSYELDDGTTSTDTFTVTPEDATAGPIVDSISISEVETDDGDAEFDTDWAVSDADGDLDAVELTLLDDSDGETEDSTSTGVGGSAASGSTRLVASGDDVTGNDYTAELVVTDSAGTSTTGAASVTEADPDPVVTTEGYSNLNATAVTLHGSLDDLGGAGSADVEFDWRESGTSTWTTTATETVTAGGSFSHEISGLASETSHEYRAVARASDGQTGTGTVADFATPTGLDRTLTIDGTDADRTQYTVAVSGEIENDPDNGSFNDNDDADGQIASGFVNGGTDGYVFSGEVVGIDVDGDASILVDGETVDPDSLVLPNRVVFDAAGSEGETTYTFEVSGDLVNDPLLGAVEDTDSIDNGTGDGSITGTDRDGFRFAGDLVGLRLDGEASVVFEDTDG